MVDIESRTDGPPVYEQVYRRLREALIFGGMEPGQAVTLRGLAEIHGSSITPVREAVRRLAAEGALQVSATGRVSVIQLSVLRIEELATVRALLEPELASRALPRAHFTLIERLENLNDAMMRAGDARDAENYIRGNVEFHRILYRRAQAPAMLAMIETVWLQLGPALRALYERANHRGATRNHANIIAALKAGDEPGLRLSVRSDVTGALKLLTLE